MFQFFQLLPSLTALENIELPLLLAGAKNTETTARERLGWVGLAEKRPRFRISFPAGRCSASPSPARWSTIRSILIADEPTGNLDTASGDLVLKLIRRAADDLGAAVLMATHSAEAAAIADVRVRMRDGRLKAWNEDLRAAAQFDSSAAAARSHPDRAHDPFDRAGRRRRDRHRTLAGDAATGRSNRR